MQILQIPRGDISVRMQSLPLLQGEYFFDVGKNEFEGAVLFIGTGTKKNYEWTPDKKDGGYLRVGSSSNLNIIGHITERKLPDEPQVGGIYIVDESFQVEDGVISNLYTEDGIGVNSHHEVSRGDLLIYTGSEWLKINNAGGAAFETSFYSKESNTLKGTTDVQSALFALDGKKLSYGGEISFDGSPFIGIPTNNRIKAEFVKFDENNGTPTSPEVVFRLGEENTRWSDIQGNFYSVKKPFSLKTNEAGPMFTKFEEGDFLAVTLNTSWKDLEGETVTKKAKASNIKFTKISGGTRDSEKIYIGKVERSQYGKIVYGTEDDKITTIGPAVKSLFKTKADIDPLTNKILLSQIPDTLIGALDYQGTFTGPNLPTKNDKKNVEQNSDPSSKTDAELVKGDYWIYIGTEKLDITANAEVNKDPLRKDADGRYYIRKGDWIIRSADNKWDVLDNTSEFIGITINGDTSNVLQGTVDFSSEGINYFKSTLVDQQIKIEKTSSGGIKLTSPNGLYKSKEPGEGKSTGAGTIYRQQYSLDADNLLSENVLEPSNLTDDSNYLIIQEESGIKLKTLKGAISITSNIEVEALNEDTKYKETEKNICLPTRYDDSIVHLATEEQLGVSRNSGPNGLKNKDILPIYGIETGLDGETQVSIKKSQLGYEVFSETDGQQRRYHSLQVREDDNSNKYELKFKYDKVAGSPSIEYKFPPLSGGILTENSIIDCGVWDAAHPNGYIQYNGCCMRPDGSIVISNF